MRRPIKLIVLLFALLVVSELAADFHVPGVWWTNEQAMGYGGAAFIALVTCLFVFVRVKERERDTERRGRAYNRINAFVVR